jgi:uncharacterized protein
MKHYPTYLQSLGLILIILLFGLLSALLVLPFASFNDPIALSFIYAGSLIGAIVSALFIRRNFTFATSQFEWILCLYGSLTALSFEFFVDPVTSLMPIPDSLKDMMTNAYTHPIPTFIMIAVLAPLLEELLFRGVVLDGFLKNYKPAHAIFASALLFALVHGNFAQGIGAFFIGLVIGWIYWKTNSVIPGIIIHFVNNGFAASAIFFIDEKDIMKNLSEYFAEPWMYWTIVAMGGVVTLLCVWALSRKLPIGGEAFKMQTEKIDSVES